MKIHTLQSRDIVLKTVQKIYDILEPTYGKNGKGVIIDFGHQAFSIDDGYKILEELEFSDPYENAILKVIKEGTRRMNLVAGDGTTTCVLLIKALLDEIKLANDDGVSFSENDLVDAVTKTCNHLVENSKKVTTLEELEMISRNSFNHPEVAPLVAEMVHKIGADGEVSVQESGDISSSIELQEGFTFEKGMVSPYMITRDDGIAELDSPLILVADMQISSLQEILPLMTQVAQDGQRSLLVIADKVDSGALNLMLVNKAKKLVTSVAVTAPFSADRKKAFFEDVALITGAVLVTADKGIRLKNIDLSHLGTAEKVVVGENKTMIIRGGGDQKKIAERVEVLKTKETKDEFEKENLQSRLAQLTNSVAVLKIGGVTEPERKYLREKADDAIRATQLAVSEGMSMGAGEAYLGFSTGVKWFDDALAFPRTVLAKNNSLSSDTVYDPTGVLVAVIQTAASIALTLVRSSGIITETNDNQ